MLDIAGNITLMAYLSNRTGADFPFMSKILGMREDLDSTANRLLVYDFEVIKER